MSGWIYLAAAVVLGLRFIQYAWRLWREYSDGLARQTFRFSIWHLSLLFAALLLDHYLGTMAAPHSSPDPGGAAALPAGRLRPLGGRRSKPSFKAIDITGADYAKELNLPDADGKPRTLADFKGKVTVVFFGYTQCPDVCPTTLAELAAGAQAAGRRRRRVQGVFVSVDPDRDTPEVLKAYVGSFGSDFVALRGTPTRPRPPPSSSRSSTTKVPGKTEGSYTMDHTAGSYVLRHPGPGAPVHALRRGRRGAGGRPEDPAGG
jgi:protein SCO1/2